MDIRFGFVSTYPPTRCGIATFNRSLVKAISNLNSHSASVFRLLESSNDNDFHGSRPEVVANIISGDEMSMRMTLRKLNTKDIAVIQHEFGIYGGEDGEEVIKILDNLRIPSLTILHTVLAYPTWRQREVMTDICRKSTAIVTMSESARHLLLTQYFVDPKKIYTIPHGSPTFPIARSRNSDNPPMILTWGLIGPGKGIEWGIEAMANLRDLIPMPRYVVAGRTHPKVFEREGEAYREYLQSRIHELGLENCVELLPEYLSNKTLAALAPSASVVLLPYDSTQQVTSGVLIEAVAARRPVIATDFPHAAELLARGVGILVPHQDPEAIAAAIRRILSNPDLAQDMSQRAAHMAPKLLWPAVATRYVQLAKSLIRTSAVA